MKSTEQTLNKFRLDNKVIIITGGAGFLGQKHAEAVAEFGAIPVLLDLDKKKVENLASRIKHKYGVNCLGLDVDITCEKSVKKSCSFVSNEFRKIDVLVNNASNNPTVNSSGSIQNTSRLENFSLELWNKDLAVGLTGAFICAKYFGTAISKNSRGGVIINISSDLGIVAPDQRLYRKNGLSEEQQSVKPITYSVVKTGLIGLTRYLATYWPEKNVRCNALCPGGIFNNQGEEFLKQIKTRIPLGRMANRDEYQSAIVFLASDASSYMNGAILNMDGGRSVW